VLAFSIFNASDAKDTQNDSVSELPSTYSDYVPERKSKDLPINKIIRLF